MIKIFILFSLLYINLFAISIDDDNLKNTYNKYDKLYKKSNKSDTVIFLHALTTFNGKESLDIIQNIPEGSKLSLEKKKYIADYYFSLGSYITAAKLYREYLEDSYDEKVVISLLTTDIVASKFEDFENDNEKYGDKLSDQYKIYLNLLYLNKQNKNKEVYNYIKDIDLEEIYSDNLTYKIKAYTIKLEVFMAIGKKIESARLAKYLVDNYQNVPEVSRWLDLFPHLGQMIKDKSTKLEGSSKKVDTKIGNSKIFYAYQFGSFLEKKNAETLKMVLESKYKSKGISIHIRKQNRSGKRIFVVTTHAFKTEKNARNYYDKNYKDIISDKIFFVKIYK